MAQSHKPLDHLVLPTAGLDVARTRLTALGFTVAPEGRHPFGTTNACVYFADGTFLEPLAVGEAETASKAIEAGNVFVARDRAYRQRLGQDGFSAAVFNSANADADHADYVEAGISAGARLDFSRPFIDAAGRGDIASFRLAFAAGPGSPDAFVFACERVNAPEVDRGALQIHANGALAIQEIVAVADDPAAQYRLLALAAGAETEDIIADGRLSLPNAMLSVLDPAAFQSRFGIAAPASALRFQAVLFRVVDLAALCGLLATNRIGHCPRDGRLVVPPAPGQGATFVFEETA